MKAAFFDFCDLDIRFELIKNAEHFVYFDESENALREQHDHIVFSLFLSSVSSMEVGGKLILFSQFTTSQNRYVFLTFSDMF
jgi:hypothetical protein